jgi:ubiquinone/menaquinone biosynthesis C-methylase UbiE
VFHRNGPTLLELIEQALSSTERGYDLLAAKFDHTPFRTPEWLLARFFEKVFQSGPVESALDVACGTGAQLKHLVPKVTRRLVGLDFSEGMLRIAKAKLGEVATLQLVRGDAREMSFACEFELVTSAGAFGHFVGEDEDRLLDGIARALTPRGRFVFLTTQMPRLTSFAYWAARGFNFAMHLRNALKAPPFVMYYLTFTWPHVSAKLRHHGFDVSASNDWGHETRGRRVVAVTAIKRAP